jgi:transcriptional regulator with XRE-family HTH domain
MRQVRHHFGDQDREAFGKSLGVSRASLAYYERGERTPDANVLSRYRTDLGVSLEWLLTGAGEMFADTSAVPSGPSFHTIKQDVFRAVGRLVASLHKAEGITLPPDALFDEQSSAYNALIERAEDPSDADELKSLLPWLETRLKRQLAAAKASPGTGKREA